MTGLNCSKLQNFTEFINFSVIRIGNIPWEISTRDVAILINPLLRRKDRINQDWVHIPIDRCTGKTLNELFVEIPTEYEAIQVCSRLDRLIMKQRAISVCQSSFEELIKSMINYDCIQSKDFISEEDVAGLIKICQNYKVHFSRKCAERPFEHILSLFRVIPWYQLNQISIDLMHKLLKQGIEALLYHYSRPSCQIDEHLVIRLIVVGMKYPAFSPAQKEDIEKFQTIEKYHKAIFKNLNGLRIKQEPHQF